MEFLKNFLDNLDKYSNLLIALLTMAIVYLAYRSLRSSQRSIQVNTLPLFFPKISIKKGRSSLILENYSNYPAYDVSALVVAEYVEEDTTHKSLLDPKYKNNVNIDFSKGLFGIYFESYGVIDRITHYSFPPQTRCEIDLDFAKVPETLQLALQFRDSLGNNYLHQCWLFSDSINEQGDSRKDLVLGYMKPSFKPAKRMEYIAHRSIIRDAVTAFKITRHRFIISRLLRFLKSVFYGLVTRSRIRIYLGKNIRDILLRSFSAGQQRASKSLTNEGRGIFTELKNT